jgi:hypothetical protein
MAKERKGILTSKADKVTEDMAHEKREKSLMNTAAKKHGVEGIDKEPGEEGYEEEEENLLKNVNKKMARGGMTEEGEETEEGMESEDEDEDDEDIVPDKKGGGEDKLAWLSMMNEEPDIEPDVREDTEEERKRGGFLKKMVKGLKGK